MYEWHPLCMSMLLVTLSLCYILQHLELSILYKTWVVQVLEGFNNCENTVFTWPQSSSICVCICVCHMTCILCIHQYKPQTSNPGSTLFQALRQHSVRGWVYTRAHARWHELHTQNGHGYGRWTRTDNVHEARTYHIIPFIPSFGKVPLTHIWSVYLCTKYTHTYNTMYVAQLITIRTLPPVTGMAPQSVE